MRMMVLSSSIDVWWKPTDKSSAEMHLASPYPAAWNCDLHPSQYLHSLTLFAPIGGKIGECLFLHCGSRFNETQTCLNAIGFNSIWMGCSKSRQLGAMLGNTHAFGEGCQVNGPAFSIVNLRNETDIGHAQSVSETKASG